MGTLELLLIAVAVSMDAFAVSMCKGLSVRKVNFSHVLLVALWFGGFQALMPLLGYFLGASFADFISAIDHWTAFVLLGFIGGKMIKQSFDGETCDRSSSDFSFKVMLAMAVATSIDALAVGVSFAFLKVNIWTSILMIGLTTAFFSGAGLFIGNIFGSRFKSKAELTGGVILVLIGLKILLDHLGIL